MLIWAAAIAALAYLAILFVIALRRDRRPSSGPARGWAYGLSLGVYCTSWTFYGAVGTAATAGWAYLPIYLGPILVFTLGYPWLRRMLRLAKAQHSTSIADFLSARYGKSGHVAALVTVVAAIGSLPYMSLQMESVGTTLIALDPGLRSALSGDDMVLIVAVAMAIFAIMFGARRADRVGDNAGMVLTIAIEAAVKIVAFAAVAVFAWLALRGAPVAAQTISPFSLEQLDARFAVLTLIAAVAIVALPRQFHMAFVEAPGDRMEGPMRWVLPVYLLAFALLVPPIVMAGLSTLPPGLAPDLITLSLPLASGNDWLALLVFLGGFSAATGMILVATVALSMMITNDLIAPVLFRRALLTDADRGALAQRLLGVRRIVIALLVLAAYLFNRLTPEGQSLAGLGILAFAAIAQLLPGLVLGLLSKRGNRQGMLAGLAVGFVGWLVLLVLPPLGGAAPIVSIHTDPLVSGVIVSLLANTAAYLVFSWLASPNLVDQAQAVAFAGTGQATLHRPAPSARRVADARLLMSQFIGSDRSDAALDELRAGDPAAYRAGNPADARVVALAERHIGGVIGSSSARLLMSSWSGGAAIPLEDMVAMLDEPSRRITASADVLQVAIENIDHGIAMVDKDMRLIAWNRRYQELFDLPDTLVTPLRPVGELIAHNMRRVGYDGARLEAEVEKRVSHMRAGRRHRAEREQPDGRILRIVGNAVPGGGYLTSYTDITADRKAEQALEATVAARTAELRQTNDALEAATRSKTRFLAAASHDLVQPLNAARLFASALREEVADQSGASALIGDLDGSIASADRLIRTLLDISKLDGGGIEPQLADIPLQEIFDEVTRDAAILAGEKDLDLRVVRTSAWVRSDRALLVSLLRNLVSNAVRYTEDGKILLGARRKGEDLRIIVADTGRGIEPDDQARIFDEFERAGSRDGEGLGLGLAIVRRVAALLDTDITLSSDVGKGSLFGFSLPRGEAGAADMPASRPVAAAPLEGRSVLAIDNDPEALRGLEALLGRWKMQVRLASDSEGAKVAQAGPPDLLIVDYQLDDGRTGEEATDALRDHWDDAPPTILLTAEATETTAAAARRMGAVRLLKPAPPAALRASILERLSGR